MPDCNAYHSKLFRDFRTSYMWASELAEGKGTSVSFSVRWDSEALAWKATVSWVEKASNREN